MSRVISPAPMASREAQEPALALRSLAEDLRRGFGRLLTRRSHLGPVAPGGQRGDLRQRPAREGGGVERVAPLPLVGSDERVDRPAAFRVAGLAVDRDGYIVGLEALESVLHAEKVPSWIQTYSPASIPGDVMLGADDELLPLDAAALDGDDGRCRDAGPLSSSSGLPYMCQPWESDLDDDLGDVVLVHAAEPARLGDLVLREDRIPGGRLDLVDFTCVLSFSPLDGDPDGSSVMPARSAAGKPSTASVLCRGSSASPPRGRSSAGCTPGR